MCCYRCELRTVGCHSKCPMYQAVYKENLKRYSQTEKNAKFKQDLNVVTGNAIKRCSRRENRYYK